MRTSTEYPWSTSLLTAHAKYLLVAETVTNHVIQRFVTILPADLLTFCVSSAMVCNRHFINAGMKSSRLDGHLGLNAESIRPPAHVFDQFAAKYFAAGGYVVNGNSSDQVTDH